MQLMAKLPVALTQGKLASAKQELAETGLVYQIKHRNRHVVLFRLDVNVDAALRRKLQGVGEEVVEYLLDTLCVPKLALGQRAVDVGSVTRSMRLAFFIRPLHDFHHIVFLTLFRNVSLGFFKP